MNYAQILLAVQKFLVNDSLGDMIPTFVDWGQDRLEGEEGLLVRDMQKVLTSPIAMGAAPNYTLSGGILIGAQTITVPTDMLQMLFLSLYNYGVKSTDLVPVLTTTVISPIVLSYLTKDSEVKEILTTNAESGTPSKFARLGTSYYLNTLSDKNYGYKIGYYAKQAKLTDAAPTNIWSLNFSKLLVYASLVEAIPYLKDENTSTEKWVSWYKEELDRQVGLNNLERSTNIQMEVE